MAATPINPIPPANYSGLADDTSALAGISSAYNQTQQDIKDLDAPDTSGTYTTPTQAEYDTAGGTISDASKYQSDKTTVAGQLSSLLGSDSQYMKQVDAKSKLLGSELGMLSSDRYIGAATGAAIREGLPIAQQDAETARSFGLGQQQGETQLAGIKTEGVVSGALKSQAGTIENQSNQFKSQLDAAAEEGKYKAETELYGYKATVDAASKDALARLDNALQSNLITNEYNLKEKLAGFQATLDKDIMKYQFDRQTEEVVRTQASDMFKTATINIAEMLQDPEILSLGPDAVGSLVNNQIELTTAGMNLLYDTANLNPNNYITGLLNSFVTANKFDTTKLPKEKETIGTETKVVTTGSGSNTTTTTTSKPIYAR